MTANKKYYEFDGETGELLSEYYSPNPETNRTRSTHHIEASQVVTEVEINIFEKQYKLLNGTVVEIEEENSDPPDSHYLRLLRENRDRALAFTDWTQLPDVPLSTKTKWATYRQALRDITETYPNGRDVVWPVPPT